MSALGQKQTCALQNVMSALPPIATMKADSRERSCLLFPRKRTHAVHQRMSALPPIATAKADIRKSSCLLYPQKRTCAVHTLMSALGQKRTSHSMTASAIERTPE